MPDTSLRDKLTGRWTHPDWSVFLGGLNQVEMSWPNGGMAFGAWALLDDDIVAITYVYLHAPEQQHTYLFKILEASEKSLKTLALAENRVEELERSL